MLKRIGRLENARLLLIGLILILISPLFILVNPQEIKAAAPNYVKDADSVYTNSSDTYIKVTPHTLTASGWVTVNFSTSNNKFLGKNIDISFGFNDAVKTTKAEEWLNLDWRSMSANQDEKVSHLGASKWQSKGSSAKVTKDTLYTTRFWVELPFNGMNKVSGKYNVAIKPSGVSIDKAIKDGSLVVLDPWYDSAWGYRKAITITGSTGGAVTNYQLQLIINYLAGADSVDFTREPAAGTNAADAGTGTTTLVDAALLGTTNDYYVGAYLYNVTRTLGAYITSYDAAAKSITHGTIAGQVVTDTYYIYAKVPFVSVNSKSQTDFDDIRFTASDGITLLDAWLESYTASANATVWVEVASIPATTTTIYMYYGNASVASNWSGTNTFIVFDDFERGVNGDPVGGAWTVVGCTISTDHTYGNGTRSARIVGVGPAYTNGMNIPVQSGINHAINYQLWKENANSVQVDHGNGVVATSVIIEADEDITYYNAVAAIIDTGFNATADQWQRWDTNKINYTLLNYTLHIQNLPIIDIPQMVGVVVATNQLSIRDVTGIVGADAYVDNVFVRNFVYFEPLITAYGATETTGNLTSVLTVGNAKVFSSYLEEDDWLITCLYLDIYEPYYSNGGDVQSLFYIQLYTDNATGNILLAQTKCPEWGYKPGAIYLSADQAASLEWGLAYRVRVYGNFAGTPYVEYTLVPADWVGDDLYRLDSWIRSVASLMETYYGTTLTTYATSKGLVLNETGGAIFNNCIPACSSCRPGCFQIVSTAAPFNRATYTQTYASGFAWQTLLGPELTAAFTNLGTSFSISGSTVGAMLGFGFYGVVAALCFPAGSAVAAISIPSVILISLWYTGLLPLASLGFILAVMSFILLWQFWSLKTG